ncbi:MAG: glutamine-hydrolyzing carbamoyl-phosphate synthase small subunit [Kiritimatiellae bacterium]|nr:glutamine-hydrolyzing carbamoyl-phosphate synthase small subunit [Kiritimatiellia bacterium]
MKALIALEDGRCFKARSFTGPGEVFGEIVFNTSMTGYQEILTDPSYHGQVVTLTYPLIGNYGVNAADVESDRPKAAGLIVGECSRIPSSWRSQTSLPDYLQQHGILGVDQVDTRAVTLHIRSRGAMKCVVSTTDPDPARLVEKARQSPGLVGRDLACDVTAPSRYDWTECGSPAHTRVEGAPLHLADGQAPTGGRPPFRVAVIDCGVKRNILRLLAAHGCALRVFPISAAAREILDYAPDGLFISNGPGDPEGVPYVVEAVRELIHEPIPTFGICFGHQLLGLALGGKTYKLKFGHRGANQPVKDLATGKVEITSQNHGFCVDKDTLDPERVATTHVNLNDGTSEGLRHKTLPVFSVQYHPEASPGPHDSFYLFQRFVELMEKARGRE